MVYNFLIIKWMGNHTFPPISLTKAWVQKPHVTFLSWNYITSFNPKFNVPCDLKWVVRLMAHMPCHPPLIKNQIWLWNWLFLNLDFSAFCPILALKCYSKALLAKYCLTGCFGWPSDGESDTWGEDVAPSLKLSPTMPKTDSKSHFYYILKFSI